MLYAGNVVSRTGEDQRQTLSFGVRVQNLAYDKCIEIHWAGEAGEWRVLPCHFAHPTGQDGEVWDAEAVFDSSRERLPGGIAFAARVRMAGVDAWDSNDGRNYTLAADAGLWLAASQPLLNVRVHARLALEDTFVPVTVAVHTSLQARQVFVRSHEDHSHVWTTRECVFWRRHWERAHASGAQNPSAAGTAIWVTHIPVQHAWRVEYAVGCTGAAGVFWDNNFGTNYVVAREPLKVMTLNLHCNQEEEADAKLSTVAQAIDDHRVDIVCLQEVAEPWEGGSAAFAENAAKKIRDRLREPYHLVHDWSHRGFGIYREGSAILTRHDIVVKDAGYVSSRHDAESIHSRKIVMAQVNVPCVGAVNIFSVHLSWWKDGFREQFERLAAWARDRATPEVAATLLLGDFNAAPDSAGYAQVMAGGEFDDALVQSRRRETGETAVNGSRIDYIFLRKDGALEARTVRRLFTPADYGRVSDHPGYYAELVPRA